LSDNHATFIWSIADLLRGSFKAHQYGDIILPFTVLRRLDAVLAPTKQAVFAAVEQASADGYPVRAFLLRNEAQSRAFRSRHLSAGLGRFLLPPV
jgi:type I restriction enzyme M protein